jgi:hypothetical protein
MKHDVIASLGRETQLLLLAARLRSDEATIEAAASAIGAGLDWDLLIRLARRKGVAPMVDRLLRVPELLERCPQERLSALRAAVRDINLRTLRIHAQARGLLALLKGAGLEAAPIKGIFLGPYLYGEASLRPAADIDLLCRGRDIPAIQRILRSGGYRRAEAPAFFPEDDLASFPVAHQPPMIKDGEPASVELHETLLAPDEPGFMDGVWRTAGRSAYFDLEVPALGPADHLLYLMIHLARHWTRAAALLQFYWLTDISVWLRKRPADFNPEGVRAKAEAWGKEKETRAALELTAGLLDSSEAAAYAERLGPVRKPSFLPLARPAGDIGLASRLRFFGQDIRSIRGWGRRMNFLRLWAFPNPKFLRSRYPNRAHRSAAFLWLWRWMDFGGRMIRRRIGRPDGRG